MHTKRIIPCLDVKAGRVVKGTNFVELRDAGDPVELGIRYSKEGADELVFLDILFRIDSGFLEDKLRQDLVSAAGRAERHAFALDVLELLDAREQLEGHRFEWHLRHGEQERH